MTKDIAAAIDRFNANYAFVVNNDVVKWPELFAEEGSYEVLTKDSAVEDMEAGFLYFERRAQLIDRINALLNASIYPEANFRHMIGACRIVDVEGGRIKATAPFAVYESRQQELPSIYATGQYEDEFVHDDQGTMLISKRRCVLDNEIVRTLMSFPI